MPKVTINWFQPPITPAISFGAISRTNIFQAEENTPVETPYIILPIQKSHRYLNEIMKGILISNKMLVINNNFLLPNLTA
jgi:hypothetical protein